MVTIPINEEVLALSEKENQKDVNIQADDINIGLNVNNIVVVKDVTGAIESSEFSRQVKKTYRRFTAHCQKRCLGGER